jgi:hypothetical protein
MIFRLRKIDNQVITLPEKTSEPANAWSLICWRELTENLRW